MTYTIKRYPVHLIDVVRAANGTRITVRPTLPQDAELHRLFFRSLSAKSRYCRFMTRLAELPEALAERFTNIDYSNHLALIAEVFVGGHEIMIGEARYIADERDRTTCEFAIAVADDWQGSGIARALIERLEREAAASGFRHMVGDALISNEAMLRFARRACFTVTPNLEDATQARLQKRLGPPQAIAA